MAARGGWNFRGRLKGKASGNVEGGRYFILWRSQQEVRFAGPQKFGGSSWQPAARNSKLNLRAQVSDYVGAGCGIRLTR